MSRWRSPRKEVQAMFDVANVNWALYEDGSEYKGMASATLPTASMLTQTLSEPE